MFDSDTPEVGQVPDAQGKTCKPPRRRPLDTLERVRREMTATYWEHREGLIALDDAKGRVHILGKISEVLKAEQNNDDELAGLLKQVREKLKGDR